MECLLKLGLLIRVFVGMFFFILVLNVLVFMIFGNVVFLVIFIIFVLEMMCFLIFFVIFFVFCRFFLYFFLVFKMVDFCNFLCFDLGGEILINLFFLEFEFLEDDFLLIFIFF